MHRSTHIHVFLAVVVLLAGGLALGVQDTVGNQQGPGVGSRTDNMIALCGMNGGGVSVDVAGDRTSGSYHSWATVECVGGALDGLWCHFTGGATVCGWGDVGNRTGPDGGLRDVTSVNEDLTFVSELPADAANPLTPAVTDQPMLVEAVITWNPSAESATGSGLVQVNACRMMDGAELVAHPDGNPGSESFTVQCDGGVIDGLWCAFGVGLSTCFFEPGIGPDAAATGDPTMTPPDAPIPTVAMSTEAPAQEPSPTATPPEPPKVTPTATTAVTPTDEPVIEPTFVPTDAGPWTVPEGTLPVLEPVEPTPTEVILT